VAIRDQRSSSKNKPPGRSPDGFIPQLPAPEAGSAAHSIFSGAAAGCALATAPNPADKMAGTIAASATTARLDPMLIVKMQHAIVAFG
jgi:hypothetical protein